MKTLQYWIGVLVVLVLSRVAHANCADYINSGTGSEVLLNAICSNEELMKNDMTLVEAYSRLMSTYPSLKHFTESEKKLLEKRRKTCNYIYRSEHLLTKCLKDNYADRTFVLSTLKTPIEKILGVYKKEVPNCFVRGGNVRNPVCYEPVEDVIVVSGESDNIEVKMELTHFNGHKCSFNGKATWVDGLLVAHKIYENDKCEIELYSDGNRIVSRVRDNPMSNCKRYCGMRASLDRAEAFRVD